MGIALRQGVCRRRKEKTNLKDALNSSTVCAETVLRMDASISYPYKMTRKTTSLFFHFLFTLPSVCALCLSLSLSLSLFSLFSLRSIHSLACWYRRALSPTNTSSCRPSCLWDRKKRKSHNWYTQARIQES